MKIKIAQEAEQYIKENGHTVAVLLGKVSGCCGGAAQMPQVQSGLPENLSGYTVNIIGDITVYVDKQIDKDKQIVIFLGKLLWLKKLSVEIM